MTRGALPNLIIVGAMKCGTTSLHAYLGQHPSVSMSRRKELNFFSNGEDWAKGIDWYRSWFAPDAAVRGEASPGYTCFPQLPGVPERMHELIPEARIIYLVRDPLDRLRADYRHVYASRIEHRPITEALATDRSPIVARSLYALQLERYLALYPSDQVLVVQQELLLTHRDAELERIFRFLGVDPAFRSPLFRYRHHRSARKRRLTDFGVILSELPGLRSLNQVRGFVGSVWQETLYRPFSRSVPPPVIPEVVESRLLATFSDDVSRLRQLTKMPLSGWCV